MPDSFDPVPTSKTLFGLSEKWQETTSRWRTFHRDCEQRARDSNHARVVTRVQENLPPRWPALGVVHDREKVLLLQVGADTARPVQPLDIQIARVEQGGELLGPEQVDREGIVADRVDRRPGGA